MLSNKSRFLFPIILLLLTGSVAAEGKDPGPQVIPGELIVKIRSEKALSALSQNIATAKQQIRDRLAAHNLRSMRPMWKEVYSRHVTRVLARHNRPSGTLAEIRNDLSRIYRVQYSGNTAPQELAKKLSRLPDVEYAEPVYIRHTAVTPNDTYYTQESAYLAAQNFPAAWNVSKGSSGVIIAIIDTGVDYTHPDLKNKMWKNMAEENGTPGVDDDGNGFVDDSIGWDFWESGNNGTNIVTDNNPVGEYSDHGTHVAGIATAATNNNLGIAGTGYNCRFMAVKVGGTQDHHDDIGFGFAGIWYAAVNGADVINCSWGGSGGSKAEQDIINQVAKMGTVVVCAAGNDHSSEAFFPASYRHVISVGSVGTSSTGGFNLKSDFSDYGPYIDVMAAGYGIYSTIFDSSYGIKSGTSMAAPMVSGLAGLIKASHPDWSAYRIESQIRATATRIDNANYYSYELGHGLIDAYKALTATTPGLDVVGHEFVNANGNKLNIGEPGTLKIFVTNYNAATQDARFTLSTSQADITVGSSLNTHSVIATGDTVEIDFPVTIGDHFDLSQVPTFRLDMSDDTYSYSDFRFIHYDKFLYDVVQTNQVQASFSSDGTIAYQDPLNSLEPGGTGFNTFKPDSNVYSGNYLFSSGLMIMANGGKLADAVRSAGAVDHDFIPEDAFTVESPGAISDADGEGLFTTDHHNIGYPFPKFNIKLETYAFREASVDKTLFLKYTITNASDTTADSVFVGLHNDWDLGSDAINSTGYVASDSLLFVYDANDKSQPYVAVAQLGNVSSNLAINNGYAGPQSAFQFGIYYEEGNPVLDGYTDKEKKNSLIAATAGDSIHILNNVDVSVATASGPYAIPRNKSIVVGFIYAFGDNLNDLLSQVRSARALRLFKVTPPSHIVPIERNESALPLTTRLKENYPNPFNPATTIQYDLARPGHVTLMVYNILGQKVATLLDKYERAGSYYIRFNGQNMSSGVYFVVMKTANRLQTQKIMLLK